MAKKLSTIKVKMPDIRGKMHNTEWYNPREDRSKDYELARKNKTLTKLKKLDARIDSVRKAQQKIEDSKIRDDAQKEIDNKIKGEWRTINGRHVFIEKGQTPTQAIEKSLKPVKPKEDKPSKKRRI